MNLSILALILALVPILSYSGLTYITNTPFLDSGYFRIFLYFNEWSGTVIGKGIQLLFQLSPFFLIASLILSIKGVMRKEGRLAVLAMIIGGGLLIFGIGWYISTLKLGPIGL